MPIDIKTEAEKLRTMYQDTDKKYANILLTGETGTGKSYLMSTAPKPVHVDSFDPGGTLGLKKFVDKGDLIPDTSFEDEDPMDPHAFSLWRGIFEERIEGGYFDQVGTYFLDSGTTWAESILNFCQDKKGGSGAGAVPLWNKDYHPQKVLIRNYIRKAMNLPCHFVFTGHLMPQKDKEGNVIKYRYLMTGQGAIVIPLLFDEIWVSEMRETSKGGEFSVLLQSGGLMLARSRLLARSDGKLKINEPSNLREILYKAGMSYIDKP